MIPFFIHQYNNNDRVTISHGADHLEATIIGIHWNVHSLAAEPKGLICSAASYTLIDDDGFRHDKFEDEIFSLAPKTVKLELLEFPTKL